MSVATFPIGPLNTNSYILNKDDVAVAIDVGGDPAPIAEYLDKNKYRLVAICITHMHFDHLYGVADLAEITKATVYEPENDSPIAETESARGGIWGLPLVKAFKSLPMPDGKTTFGNMECVVLQTPGHTPGGVSLYFPEQKSVFVGDALFFRSIGRTDFPMGNQDQLLKSIKEQLFALPGDTVVYPGHGPATTIEAERLGNPFCGEFNN